MATGEEREGELRIELCDGVRTLDRSAWDDLVGDDSPFLEWAWLASLEEAGCVGARTGWDARPLVVREGDALVAACPLYVKSHSEGEFVFDWGWADAAYRAGIDYYPKLLVGVPFTPVTGARFLTAPDVDRPALVAALVFAMLLMPTFDVFPLGHHRLAGMLGLLWLTRPR